MTDKNRNLVLRVVTVLVLLPGVLWLIGRGGLPFALLIAGATAACALELNQLPGVGLTGAALCSMAAAFLLPLLREGAVQGLEDASVLSALVIAAFADALLFEREIANAPRRVSLALLGAVYPGLLLAALIPVLGAIGTRPALLALFIFALLPIVRNTAVGLAQVPETLRQAATALGARSLVRLWTVELPLASPVILAGIRTAAVISVGTATIGAFVGAGGFGERISIGLALNDDQMLLAGALPAAALALGFEASFSVLEWAVRFRLRMSR